MGRAGLSWAWEDATVGYSNLAVVTSAIPTGQALPITPQSAVEYD